MPITVNPIIDINSRVAQILYLDQGVAVFACLGNPNGVITAFVGSIAFDETTGNVYRKTSGTGNSGWTLTSAPGLVGAYGAFPPTTTIVQNSGATATALHQITIPANALLSPSAGRFKIAAAGVVGANANSKTIALQIGGITLQTFTGAINNLAWQLFVEGAVITPTTISYTSWFNAGVGATNLTQSFSGNTPLTIPTLTTAQIVQILATGVATGDIFQNLMTLEIG